MAPGNLNLTTAQIKKSFRFLNAQLTSITNTLRECQKESGQLGTTLHELLHNLELLQKIAQLQIKLFC